MYILWGVLFCGASTRIIYIYLRGSNLQSPHNYNRNEEYLVSGELRFWVLARASSYNRLYSPPYYPFYMQICKSLSI